MQLSDITPLVLTYNEAPNIARCLARLSWARDVVVVDSNSTDDTVALASSFPNVRVLKRTFDTHAQQWNFGVQEAGISIPWVLSLDADYLVEPKFIAELEALAPSQEVTAYRTPFEYRVLGRNLRGSAYPEVTVLFQRELCEYVQDGHTQRLMVRRGSIHSLRNLIVHDDRKPLSRWLVSQANYMDLEARKLLDTSHTNLSLADRVRKCIVLAPLAMLGYCLVLKRGILDGWPGWYYAFQRTAAEIILSLKLIEHKLLASPPGRGDAP